VGEYDRYNMQRLVSMTGNIEGEDLGRVSAHIAAAIQTVNDSLWSPAQDKDGNQGWKNAIGGELVVEGDLGALTDGQAVTITAGP
jgi:hypothetical protein